VKDQSPQIRTGEVESPWQKASYANLIRYASSGCYFARIKIGGKLIRQSLAGREEESENSTWPTVFR
jgi:hypothetical protein